jgi:aminopeptidase N
MMRTIVWLALWLCAAPLSAAPSPPSLQHDLTVSLQPEQQSLRAIDVIILPAAMRTLRLELHTGLNPRFYAEQGEVEVVSTEAGSFIQRYQLKLPPGTKQFAVEYEGAIHHDLSSSRAEQARGFRDTAGIIDAQGVFLSGGSAWYPMIEGHPTMTANLDVLLPPDWKSVSQGRRSEQDSTPEGVRERWSIEHPQEEIYLIAGKFTEYSRAVGSKQKPILAQVYLREPDPALAVKYLDATALYLKMYQQLLGDYPYSKFALVENFWETGFGMPSFTLLGPRVLRLPFIINTSYPHEILHNWWGNGVYVDYATGNWSEGLTAYLADHLIKEQQGQGADYRQQTLQKYRDYAAQGRDFALNEFRSRHSSATEAVGYGKTLMLFHMLRNKLGDEQFVQGLQQFYQQYQYRRASFADLQRVFEQVSGQSLQAFFSQWVQRTGAPELVLKDTRVETAGSSYRLVLTIAQVQAGEPYQLDIPVAVSVQGQAHARVFTLAMNAKQQSFTLDLNAPPTRVDIDPQFDLFRKLAVAETPPALTRLFGAKDLLVVLPSQAPAELKSAWQAFAEDMSHMGPERVEIVWDTEIDTLPDDRAVAVLGWRNRFTTAMQQQLVRHHPLDFKPDAIRIGTATTPRAQHAFAWITRAVSEDADQATPVRALITADLANALPGLGRKLPHYHKYSYLGFAGVEPENVLKGRWPVTDSPMSVAIGADAVPARLPKASALIEPVSPFDAERMMATIRYLSDEKLEGRGLGSAGLDQAADYIAEAFKAAGLVPAGDDGNYFQVFSAPGEDGELKQLKNVVGVIPGQHPQRAGENLVIGAHYDHLGLGWPDVRGENRGRIHPGADDNASGIAVLLELARVLGAGLQPDRSIVCVAFSGEEAGRAGSRYYINSSEPYPVSRVIAMLNLDTVGRLFDGKLMVFGSETASEWPPIFRGIGFVTGIASVMVNEPLDASDQVSFHEAGVPAVQLFTGPHTDYHRPGDTADKIDADGLVKVAEVSRQVIEYLASREQPLSSTLEGATPAQPRDGSRKVSLGTIPDFTYQGEGYRLDGVVPGSAAEQAGLQKMDIITAIDDQAIQGIRDLSAILKQLEPGQTIVIDYLRDEQPQRTRATVETK